MDKPADSGSAFRGSSPLRGTRDSDENAYKGINIVFFVESDAFQP